MDKKIISDLIDRYLSLSFNVNKKAESLIKAQIGEELTTDQHHILCYVQQAQECTSSELAEAFDVNKSAITAIINRLTDRGLIERTRDQADRRVVYLTLTEKGHQIQQATQDKIHLLVESFITQFEETEITNFINTYEKLDQILTKMKNEEMEE